MPLLRREVADLPVIVEVVAISHAVNAFVTIVALPHEIRTRTHVALLPGADGTNLQTSYFALKKSLAKHNLWPNGYVGMGYTRTAVAQRDHDVPVHGCACYSSHLLAP